MQGKGRPTGSLCIRGRRRRGTNLLHTRSQTDAATANATATARVIISLLVGRLVGWHWIACSFSGIGSRHAQGQGLGSGGGGGACVDKLMAFNYRTRKRRRRQRLIFQHHRFLHPHNKAVRSRCRRWLLGRRGGQRKNYGTCTSLQKNARKLARRVATATRAAKEEWTAGRHHSSW